MVRRRRGVWALAMIAAVAMGACKPEFSERSSAVEGLRLLAIQGDPPEDQPRAASPTIQYTALLVDSMGPRHDVSLDWAYCTEPKPVAELNDVSQACFAREGSWILPMTAAGDGATGALPISGCRQFGPNPPSIGDAGTLGRPADPDSTGGYYQPLRVLSSSGDALQAVGQTRLRCDLAGAGAESLLEYTQRYRLNSNPKIDALVDHGHADQPLVPDADGVAPLEVAAGTTIHFRVRWATCDTNVPCLSDATDQCPEPDPCTGAESYVLYDLASQSIVERREAMRVSWFTTGGSFANDNTGRAVEEYPVVTTDDDWTAPSTAGDVFLWVVLRDSRGGTSWNQYRVSVR
jgi:hypothetical protein